MKASYPKEKWNFAETQIRYGQEQTATNAWREIVAEQDITKRRLMVDQLVLQCENNREVNGFWGKEDDIKICMLGNAIRVDDNDLYYSFFDTLAEKIESNKGAEKPQSEGLVNANSIVQTIGKYFGGMGMRSKRDELTTSFHVVDGEPIQQVPSIKNLKEQNCAECVERAATAHNLWLMLGKKAFYVNSTECRFPGSDAAYQNDGHAFNIIEISDGKYNLFDQTMGNFGRVSGNPIEDMLNGKPFIIDSMRTNGVYTNADKVGKEDK